MIHVDEFSQEKDFTFVVGITGRHGAGKSTFADFLAGELEAYFLGRQTRPTLVRHGFTPPINQIASTILEEKPNKEKAYRIGRKTYSGREVLEIIGNNAFDKIPNLWSHLFAAHLDTLKMPYPLVIADDVRFVDQADCCDFLVIVDQQGYKPPSGRELDSEREIPLLRGWKWDKNFVLRTKHNGYAPPVGDIAARIAQAWDDVLFIKNAIFQSQVCE